MLKNKSKKINKKKRGRPSKLDSINLDQVFELAKLGLTEKQISAVLGVCPATLTKYKYNDEFVATIKKGKEIADSEVIKSLYKRAMGYDYEEKVIENGKVVRVTKKHEPADKTAIIFWLKNRQPDSWKDTQEVHNTHSFFKDAFSEAAARYAEDELRKKAGKNGN